MKSTKILSALIILSTISIINSQAMQRDFNLEIEEIIERTYLLKIDNHFDQETKNIIARIENEYRYFQQVKYHNSVEAYSTSKHSSGSLLNIINGIRKLDQELQELQKEKRLLLEQESESISLPSCDISLGQSDHEDSDHI